MSELFPAMPENSAASPVGRPPMQLDDGLADTQLMDLSDLRELQQHAVNRRPPA